MFSRLPLRGRVVFKDDGGTLLTSGFACWGPLVSTYNGVEVSQPDVKNTSLFVVFGFTQWRLSARLVDQGDYIWIDENTSYLITGLKDHGSHTEFIGLREGGVESSSVPGGLVSEWAFRSLSQIGDDENGANFLTDVNSVGWNSDKPSQVGSGLGSLVLVASNSENLEISDGSQMGLDLSSALTFAFRVKLGSTPANAWNIFAKTDNVNQVAYEVFTDTSRKIQCKLSTSGSGGTVAVGGTALTVGVWYSGAVVYNGTDIRIYLDGALDSSADNPKSFSGSVFNSSAKFALGVRSDDVNYFDGRFAHVFVFNVAKSSTQVSDWHTNDSWT